MKNATELLKFFIKGFFFKFEVVATTVFKATSRKNYLFISK